MAGAPYAAWTDVEKLLAAIPGAHYDLWAARLAEAGSTPDQFYIDEIAPDIDASINSFCHRSFDAITETRNYRGNGLATLNLEVFPIREVQQITLYMLPGQVFFTFQPEHMLYTRKVDAAGNVVSTATNGADPHMEVSCADGQLNILPAAYGLSGWNETSVFPYFVFVASWWQNVAIAMTYGYEEATRPQDIRGAAAKLAAATLAIQIGSFGTAGMSSVSLGPESRSWGGGGGGVPDEFAGLLTDGPFGPLRNSWAASASRTLKRYKKVNVS